MVVKGENVEDLLSFLLDLAETFPIERADALHLEFDEAYIFVHEQSIFVFLKDYYRSEDGVYYDETNTLVILGYDDWSADIPQDWFDDPKAYRDSWRDFALSLKAKVV